MEIFWTQKATFESGVKHHAPKPNLLSKGGVSKIISLDEY
jgi:hypothetical protein